MPQNVPAPEELVLTEGEQVPPPGPTVPEPEDRPAGPSHPAAAGAVEDYEALLEVKQLARRVGGLEKLREMVDVLIRLKQ